MLIHREIAIFMLDADAIAVVDAPSGKHHCAIQGGINNLVAVGDNVDTKMSIIGIKAINNGASERDKEVFHQ